MIIRKGFHRTIDSYSAFFENDRTTPTGLDGYLRARGFRRIFFAGLATDYCVAWSAEDAMRLGYAAFVIEDASRAIALPTAAAPNHPHRGQIPPRRRRRPLHSERRAPSAPRGLKRAASTVTSRAAFKIALLCSELISPRRLRRARIASTSRE